MPTASERNAAIRSIAREACRLRRPQLGTPLRTLFFGTHDCLAASAVITAVLFLAGLLFMHGEKIAPLLFVLSPMLYGCFGTLVAWKEDQYGVREWRRTCRVSEGMLTAERMLVICGACVLLIVPVDLALWHARPDHFDFLWMAGLSFASLFLYALLALLFQRVRRGNVLCIAVWCAIFAWLTLSERSEASLLAVPAAVLYGIGAACLAVFLVRIRREFLAALPQEAFHAAD